MQELEIIGFQREGQTAEIIAFPNPDALGGVPTYYVMDGSDEVCLLNTLSNARNVARILAADWPGVVFTVVDDDDNLLFTSGQEVN